MYIYYCQCNAVTQPMWLKCSNAHRLCRQCRQCGYHSAAGDMVMQATAICKQLLVHFQRHQRYFRIRCMVQCYWQGEALVTLRQKSGDFQHIQTTVKWSRLQLCKQFSQCGKANVGTQCGQCRIMQSLQVVNIIPVKQVMMQCRHLLERGITLWPHIQNVN